MFNNKWRGVDGRLSGVLSEVANAFTQEYEILVRTEFASSGSLKDRYAIALNQSNLSG